MQDINPIKSPFFPIGCICAVLLGVGLSVSNPPESRHDIAQELLMEVEIQDAGELRDVIILPNDKLDNENPKRSIIITTQDRFYVKGHAVKWVGDPVFLYPAISKITIRDKQYKVIR